VNLPGRLTRLTIALATLQARGLLAGPFTGVPTAITHMNPSNRFLQELASMPIVEGVTAHWIIAVQGDGNPEDGADGIVMYKSAHIDGVASEKVVRSSLRPRVILKRFARLSAFCWSTLVERLVTANGSSQTQQRKSRADVTLQSSEIIDTAAI
jgi:hypothetical protein